MWTWTVYTIRDGKGDVFYVGSTVYPPMTRFNQHRCGKTKLSQWIRDKIEAGLEVHLVIERQWESGTSSTKHEKACRGYEVQLIKQYAASRGNLLFNHVHNRESKLVKVFKAEDYKQESA